jgi:hypothetical protein
MHVSKRSTSLTLGLILLACPFRVRAATPTLSPPTHLSTEDQRLAVLARNLQLRNWSYDDIFAALCRAALTNAETNADVNIQDEVRSIWGGMWLWTCNDVEPLPLFHAGGLAPLHPAPNGTVDHGYDVVTLQKLYAQHFIAGGMFEAYFDSGRWAGARKEKLNSVTGGYFDYNKLAVTSMGARWVDVAVDGDAQHTRRWLELWASHRYILSKSLPRLHWRSLPPFVDSTPEEVKAVEDEVDAAITCPPETNAPPPVDSPAKPR